MISPNTSSFSRCYFSLQPNSTRRHDLHAQQQPDTTMSKQLINLYDANQCVPSFEIAMSKIYLTDTFMHHDIAAEVAAHHRQESAIYCDISARNAQDSPLLRLPGEIRNGIYAYVNENCRRIHCFNPPAPLSKRTQKAKTSTAPTPKRQLHHSLLATCRQTHSETAMLHFCQPHFRPPHLLVNSLSAFLEIPTSMSHRQRTHMTELCLVLNWRKGLPQILRYLSRLQQKGLKFGDLLPGVRDVALDLHGITGRENWDGLWKKVDSRLRVQEWMEEGGMVAVETRMFTPEGDRYPEWAYWSH